MRATIFLVFLIIIVVPLSAGVRESHSAESTPETLNALLPDDAGCIFPSIGETGMPQQVTVVWSYGQDPLRTASEFEIYKDTVLQGTVPCSGTGFYSYQISGLAWGSTTHWQVVPVNAAGDCPTLYTWDFSVMAEPANPDKVPSAVVYMVSPKYSGDDPDPIVLPEIDLGEGDFAPQADFQYASAVSNFDIGVRFSDQPFESVLNPEFVAAAFSADFPAGVQVNATFTYSGSIVSDEMMRWNGSAWETVPGVTFGAGWVNFTFTSTTRGEEQFVVNDGGGTLPVTMSSFNAVLTGSEMVTIQWITQSESDMFGYNVYRNMDENVSDALIINPSIIPAINTATEQVYSWTDDELAQTGDYYYWLSSIELSGQTTFYGPAHIALQEEPPPADVIAGIHEVYPNPFNPRTTISYGLKSESSVVISIFDVRGRLVRKFDQGVQSTTQIHTLEWDGTNEKGNTVGSGVYLIRLQTDDMNEMRKAMLLK